MIGILLSSLLATFVLAEFPVAPSFTPYPRPNYNPYCECPENTIYASDKFCITNTTADVVYKCAPNDVYDYDSLSCVAKAQISADGLCPDMYETLRYNGSTLCMNYYPGIEQCPEQYMPTYMDGKICLKYVLAICDDTTTPSASASSSASSRSTRSYMVPRMTTSATSSSQVQPEPSTSRQVEPSSSNSRQVEPSVSNSIRVEPSASTSRRVDPSASNSRQVEPSASTSRRVDPSTSNSRQVEPSASTSRRFEPSPRVSIEVEPSPSNTIQVRATPKSTNPPPSASLAPCIRWACANGVFPVEISMYTTPICLYLKYDATRNSAGVLTCPHGGQLWGTWCSGTGDAYMVPCSEAPSPIASNSCADMGGVACQVLNSVFQQLKNIPLIPRPSLKPAASPLAQFSPRPFPSPWPVIEVPNMPLNELPSYFPSRLSLIANRLEEFEKPAVIQKLQASLACSLRLAVEKILIQNITYLDTLTNAVRRIRIDPTDFMISSMGNNACFEVTNTPRRRLQTSAVTGTYVNVDYLVFDPTTQILALNISTLNQIITTSPLMTTLAGDLGSQILTTSVLADSSNSPTPTKSVAPRTNYDAVYASIFPILGVVAIIGIAITTRKYMKKRTQSPSRPMQNSTLNPIRDYATSV